MCVKPLVLLELQPREDLNHCAPFRGAYPGREAVCSLQAGIRVINSHQQSHRRNGRIILQLQCTPHLGHLGISKIEGN